MECPACNAVMLYDITQDINVCQNDGCKFHGFGIANTVNKVESPEKFLGRAADDYTAIARRMRELKR